MVLPRLAQFYYMKRSQRIYNGVLTVKKKVEWVRVIISMIYIINKMANKGS